MKRGDVLWADMNPPRGTEPGKTRPVVVIQTDMLNDVGHLSTIVAIISTNVLPQPDPLRLHIAKGIAGLERPSDVLLDQIRAIDNRRFRGSIGRLSSDIMADLAIKLRRILDLP